MKRINSILIMVLAFSMVAFVPYHQTSYTEFSHPKPVSTTLVAPTLLSPPNGATVSGTVTFTWSSVTGAAHYHIQAGLNPYFDQQYNIIDTGTTSPSYSFTPSAGFIVYFPHLYWRVQAIDANNVGGPWSQTWLVYLKSQ